MLTVQMHGHSLVKHRSSSYRHYTYECIFGVLKLWQRYNNCYVA